MRKQNEFAKYYKNLGGGLNQAVPPTDIDDSQTPMALNCSLDKVLSVISKRYGNHRLGDTTSGTGKIYGLFEHNDNVGGYTKYRIVDGGDLEQYDSGTETWSVTDSAEFTTQLNTDGVNFSVSGDPRLYMVNGTDTLRYTDENGTCTTVGTLTGSGQRIVKAQGRMFMSVFSSASKSNRFEWTKTFTDQFYKDGESYATSTNYELIDEPITCIDVLDDNPIIFGRNSVYYWDPVGNRKTKISNKGTASLWGSAVIPDSNLLIYAGLDNIYSFRFGQRFTKPLGNRLINGLGTSVYELISTANRSNIKIGVDGYKAYIWIGDITVPNYDEDGDLAISDACIEYDSKMDTFMLHDNFHVNVFRTLTDSDGEQLYYGSEDTKSVYGVENGTDFNDHDSTGANVAIDGRFRLHSLEVQSPSVAKHYRTVRLRMRPQSTTSKYLTVYHSKNDQPMTKIIDETVITSEQRIDLNGDTTDKWMDRWFDIPASESLFTYSLEFRNADTGTNMPIQEIYISGNYTSDLHKFLVDDDTND